MTTINYTFSKDIESRLINLSSQTATTKNNGNFLSNVQFQLTGLVKEEEDIEKIEIQLLNAQIPVSFYTINYTNNLFKFKLDVDPIITATIPVGNYNGNSLINALFTAINDNNFSITINKITGKLLFSHNKSFIIYNDFNYSIGSILGFEPNSTNQSSLLHPHTLTPQNPLNLLGIKRISILSNELPCTNYSSNYKGACTLLASIPVDATTWGMINYHNYTQTKHLLRIDHIDNIDIQMLDEFSNYINFNNCDWCLTFAIDITRIKRSLPNQTLRKITDGIQEIKLPNSSSIKSATKNNNNEISDLDILTYNQKL